MSHVIERLREGLDGRGWREPWPTGSSTEWDDALNEMGKYVEGDELGDFFRIVTVPREE